MTRRTDQTTRARGPAKRAARERAAAEEAARCTIATATVDGDAAAAENEAVTAWNATRSATSASGAGGAGVERPRVGRGTRRRHLRLRARGASQHTQTGVAAVQSRCRVCSRCAAASSRRRRTAASSAAPSARRALSAAPAVRSAATTHVHGTIPLRPPRRRPSASGRLTARGGCAGACDRDCAAGAGQLRCVGRRRDKRHRGRYAAKAEARSEPSCGASGAHNWQRRGGS
mmetsp:Transcript_90/g.330  ORF Transcript_90/g.330 Transcript_90/m.330 type:complete len:231 (+) Transcript_90:1797-2489(+)